MVQRYVAELQVIISEVAESSDDHKAEGCYNCQFSLAAKSSPELMQIMDNAMSHICALNPLVMLMGEDGVRPIVQSLFDVWCMASLSARKATINEIEKGELEVWKSMGRAATGK